MHKESFRILVTGANGFVGSNLVARLSERPEFSVFVFNRGDEVSHLADLVARVDAIVHLAGESRPVDAREFFNVNEVLTRALCACVEEQFHAQNKFTPIVFASSSQALLDNAYGRSKLAAEQSLLDLKKRTGNPCAIFRFPGIFGKWSKPNYNSVVATFCYNISRGLPVVVRDASAEINLVYIDDVVSSIINCLKNPVDAQEFFEVEPIYRVTLGEIEKTIRCIADGREALEVEEVGQGFVGALYSTYISFLPNEKFSYKCQVHSDPRGVFVEMLKTSNSGQVAYFSAFPGITRGGHYHNSKTEKFLVVKGVAKFRFHHILSNEVVEVYTCGEVPEIVESIPGWAHDVTNIGDDDLIVVVWASERFDESSPDTVTFRV